MIITLYLLSTELFATVVHTCPDTGKVSTTEACFDSVEEAHLYMSSAIVRYCQEENDIIAGFDSDLTYTIDENLNPIQ